MFISFVLTPLAGAQEAFSFAIKTRQLAQVEALIEAGTDVNQRGSTGSTPLMEAVITNQLSMVQLLVEAGADVNAQLPSNAEGSSVMKFAAKYASPTLLRYLIDQGGSLDGTITAMAYVNRGSIGLDSIAGVLLEAGATIDDVVYFYDLFDVRTVLDYFPCLGHVKHASYNGGSNSCNGQAAEVVLDALNRRDISVLAHADTLAFAASVAGPNLVSALLDGGLDPNEVIVRTEDGATTTPLELALYRHNRGAANVLLARGARLKDVDTGVLQRAALDAQLAGTLRRYGADVTALEAAFYAANQPCRTPVSESAFVSFIFDDGERKDLELIDYIFAPRGQVGTLAIIAGLISSRTHTNYDDLYSVRELGWEIASHSLYHNDQTTLDPLLLDNNLRESRDILARAGLFASTFVYPYGRYTSEVVDAVSRYYDAAFIYREKGYTDGIGLNNAQSNRYTLTRYNISARHSLAGYLDVLDKAIADDGWLVWTIHSSFDTGWWQQQNLAQLLDATCERGVAVVTVSEGLARLEGN
ncbi:MAG: ankyrin repeat domain-containing protein [Deinococcota bacterium]